MKVPGVRIVISFVCLGIVHLRVANSSQYLLKCNRENTKCLSDISSKGFIAKETNVPGFYSAEDPKSPLNKTDDTLTSEQGISIVEDSESPWNLTDNTLNNVSGFSIAEDSSAPLNITDDILENIIPVQETRGYVYPERNKFSKIASKSEAKLKAIEGVELVEEQIYEKRVKKTRDTNWNDMWAVNGAVVPSMKVIEAWNLGYSGRGIYIAVVDDGVDISHIDLFANTRSVYHYDYVADVQDPSPVSGHTHGTNCAGLIGAERDNSKCISGIAYQASIVGIRLLGFRTTDLMEGNSLSHEFSNIDIYSNSWGPEDGYGFSPMRTLTSAAIENGIKYGRNGKVTIYVWAAGNGGLNDNCNADGYVNSIYTISISSINSYKESATYAEVCTPVLAVTYGGGGGSYKYLYSTSPGNMCTGHHEGTSFSAPQAAAMIALTLEANPDLTWRDVQHIIVRTSKRHDLRDGTYNWQINGANRSVHPVLGFGIMDAEAMVKTAYSWRSVPHQSKYTTLTRYPYSYISTWNIYTGVTSQITIQNYDTSIRYLEHVVVSVYFKSDSIGDTEPQLTSPEETTSYLLTSRPLEAGHRASVEWQYMTVQHWGESPVGIWTFTTLVSSARYSVGHGWSGKYPLVLESACQGRPHCTDVNVFQDFGGMLYSWQITFYGTSQDPVYDNRSDTSNCTKSNGEVPIRSTMSYGTASVHSTKSYGTASVHSTKSYDTASVHSTKSYDTASVHSTKPNDTVYIHSTKYHDTVTAPSTKSYDTASVHSTKPNDTVYIHSTKYHDTVTAPSTKSYDGAPIHSNTNDDSTRNLLGIIASSVCGGIALVAIVII